MKRLTQLVLMLLLVPLVASAQFQFAGVFPADSSAINSHGLAVDMDGKVWNSPYFSSLINDGAERINPVYVYNADGTQASFSPIIGTVSGDSLLRFGPLTGISVAADGNIYVASHGFRMTATTDGAVIGGVWNQRRSFIHKIDAKTGAGIAVVEVTYMRTETASHSPNRPAVTSEGYVAFSFVFPASPIIIVDSNNGYELLATVTDNKSGFSRTLEISADGTRLFNPNTEPYEEGGAPGHIQVWKANSVFDEYAIVQPLAIGTDPGAIARYPNSDIIFASGAGTGNAPLAGTLTMGNRYYGYLMSTGEVVSYFDWNYSSEDDPYKIPRAMAFSHDGLTAVVGSFSNAAGALQKFTTSAPIDGTPRPDPDGFDVPIWSIAAGDLDWFVNDNNTRGFTYNPATGNVIVVSRSGGPNIRIINGTTGMVMGQLSTEGISGGTFPVSLIDASPDGRIYATNLSLNATADPFKIYMWENETATPVVLYSGDINGTAARFGDSFRADFTGATAALYAGGPGGNPRLAQFNLSATHNEVAETVVFTFDPAVMRAVRGMAPIAGQDSIWINEFDFTLKKMSTQTGQIGTVIPETVFPTKEALWVDYAVMNGKAYAAVFPSSLAAAGQSASLIDLATGTEVAFTPAGANGNGNGSGGPIFDAVNNRMFLLSTNNHISAYDLTKYVGGGTTTPSTIDVTFTVNTSTIPDTVRVGDLVQIRGSVNGAEGDHFGTTINWGSGSVALQNAGGDYWKTTLKMAPGDRLVYKIYTGKQGADGIVDHAGGGWEANNPDPISNDYILEVPANVTGNIELPVIYFNRTAPFVSKADSIALFFRVNVGNQIATGALNPATDVVGVRGNPIFDWGSTLLLLEPETMPAGSRNVLYSGTIWVPKSMSGNAFKFKYVFGREDNINTGNISWDNGDDAVNPDGDGNNQVVVGRADTTYAFKFFEGRRPPMADIVSASVQFAVNVGVLEEFGFFNRNVGDKVSVPGGFNGWNTGSTMDYNEAFDAWTSAYPITEEVGARIAYKYFIDWDPSRTDATSANYIPNLPGGWEEPGLYGGGDRVHMFTNETTQTTDDFGSGVAFFNSIPPQGIIRQTFDGEKVMPVKFVVDMAPALDHSTPFNPNTDNLYLIVQTPLFGLTQELAVGDALPILDQPQQLERVKFTRVDGPGTLFELTLPVKLPTENHIGFVLAYVQPGENGERVVNGAGFSAGRRYYRYIQPLDASDRDDILWPSSAELNPITWKATNLDFEAPPEYGLEVSIDRESTMPGEFALYQNFPNPFNPTTNISFTLPLSENVQLSVYNVLGQRVATLVNGTMPAGTHTVNFNAANLASGVYIYSIRAGNFVQNRTMMLVK
jgi:hypothetical protein